MSGLLSTVSLSLFLIAHICECIYRVQSTGISTPEIAPPSPHPTKRDSAKALDITLLMPMNQCVCISV